MERYGYVLVKAFTERVDGPGLEAVVVNYKTLHDQASGRSCHSCVVIASLTDMQDQLQLFGTGLSTRTQNSLKTSITSIYAALGGGGQKGSESFEASVTSAGPPLALSTTTSWYVQYYRLMLSVRLAERSMQWLSCSVVKAAGSTNNLTRPASTLKRCKDKRTLPDSKLMTV